MIIREASYYPQWARILGLLFFMISSAVNISTLFWIHRLSKIDCKCSEDYKREPIKYFLTIIIPVQIAMFIYLQFYSWVLKSDFVIGAYATFTLLNITNVVMLLWYIYNLQKQECKCSEAKIRTFYYWYKIAMMTIWFIITFLIPILIIIASFLTILYYGIKTGKPFSSKNISKSRK